MQTHGRLAVGLNLGSGGVGGVGELDGLVLHVREEKSGVKYTETGECGGKCFSNTNKNPFNNYSQHGPYGLLDRVDEAWSSDNAAVVSPVGCGGGGRE